MKRAREASAMNALAATPVALKVTPKRIKTATGASAAATEATVPQDSPITCHISAGSIPSYSIVVSRQSPVRCVLEDYCSRFCTKQKAVALHRGGNAKSPRIEDVDESLDSLCSKPGARILRLFVAPRLDHYRVGVCCLPSGATVHVSVPAPSRSASLSVCLLLAELCGALSTTPNDIALYGDNLGEPLAADAELQLPLKGTLWCIRRRAGHDAAALGHDDEKHLLTCDQASNATGASLRLSGHIDPVGDALADATPLQFSLPVFVPVGYVTWLAAQHWKCEGHRLDLSFPGHAQAESARVLNAYRAAPSAAVAPDELLRGTCHLRPL